LGPTVAVSTGNDGKLERRVVQVAEAALAERKFVTAIDVLVGLGCLAPRRLDGWRQGRVDCLERVVIASLGKIMRNDHFAISCESIRQLPLD
jgi:hypothetical protein